MGAPGQPPLLNTFSRHYRARYGEPVGKIPIDIGLVCPNREKGGCIFCRPAGFTPGYLDGGDPLPLQVARGKEQLLRGRFRRYFAYLQQESCTALPARQLLPMLGSLLADPDCIGLILSTRPDLVHDELLRPLAILTAGSGKECLFELGMQSAHAGSLALLNRNHSFGDVVECVGRIRAAGPFGVGVHLIFGIPGEREEEMLASLAAACRLGVDALKLHHLQVIRDTPLHRMHLRQELALFSPEAYLEFLLRALPLIPARVVIHRLWATAHPELLVAPKWNILATHLSRQLQQRMYEQGTRQGAHADAGPAAWAAERDDCTFA